MTLEELEKRIVSLERDVALLKQERNGAPAQSCLPKTGVPILDEARARQPEIAAAVRKAFAEMGIVGESIGAKKVQELLLAEGIDPAANEFSRGIIAMREE